MISILSKLRIFGLYAFLILSLASGSYFYGLSNGKDITDSELVKGLNTVIQKQQELYLLDQEDKQEVIKKVSEAISQIEIKNEVIYNEIQKEIIKEPVYTDCVFTNDGLRLVNKALSNKSN